MPGLAPRGAATSRKGVKKAASRNQKKEGGGESARDATKGAGYNNYEAPKQDPSDAGVSAEAGAAVNTFVKDIFERIAGEASRLAHYNRRATITSREIHTAMRLLLPRELIKHAGAEDTKPATKYASAKRA